MFRDSIQKTIERLDPRGGAAGILMGFDGIAVDSFAAPGASDIQTIGMEMAHLITQMRRSTERVELGGLQEMTLRTESLAVLVQVVSREYFLALGIPPEANQGKARYLLRVLAPQIRAEL